MFVSIFPYFLDSSVYRNWQMRDSSMSSKSLDSGDIEDTEDQYEKDPELKHLNHARQEGRAHQLVLGAAAFFDADHLQTMLESKQWMHLVSHVIDKSSISVTIANAKAPGFPIVYSNYSFQKLTGYSAFEVSGKSATFLHGPESSTIEVNRIQRALKAKKSLRSEIICYKKNGKTFKNMLIMQPIFNHLNEFSYVLEIQCDITENGSLGIETVRGIEDLLSLVPYMLVKQ